MSSRAGKIIAKALHRMSKFSNCMASPALVMSCPGYWKARHETAKQRRLVRERAPGFGMWPCHQWLWSGHGLMRLLYMMGDLQWRAESRTACCMVLAQFWILLSSLYATRGWGHVGNASRVFIVKECWYGENTLGKPDAGYKPYYISCDAWKNTQLATKTGNTTSVLL